MTTVTLAQPLPGEVDPFLGCAATELPPASGIAATWWWRKAMVGNTHPGACLPLGLVSVCPYSGGYPTGYGLYHGSSSGLPERLYEDYVASGFTHFQQSGTGAIGVYYNYLRVTPLVGAATQPGALYRLKNEQAAPGRYSAELGDSGILAELTVADRVACHRYTFPATASRRLVVDLTQQGLYGEGPVEACQAVRQGENRLVGQVTGAGLPVYFCVEWQGRGWEPVLVVDGEQQPQWQELAVDDLDETTSWYGLALVAQPQADDVVRLRIGFSLRSTIRAAQSLAQSEARTFDAVRQAAAARWADMLGRVRVGGGTPAQRTLLYTSLYRSLLKPADASGENPLRDDDGPFVVDLATMWDVYKTQLPLLVLLYPQQAATVANSLLTIAGQHDEFPIAYLMRDPLLHPTAFKEQASALAHTMLADALVKGVTGIDAERALTLMARTFARGAGREFALTGRHPQPTHVLDYAGAAFCTAQVAKRCRATDVQTAMQPLARQWRGAFNPATGRLPAGEYYEGGSWTYSFRLLHDMQGRIELAGGREAFVAQLDCFFGFAPAPAEDFQPWEGLNNEADMAAPYAYHYAGRPDRTVAVVRAALAQRFAPGRGGLPGNDDSGGTSAWYVWSALGLFPVPGQDVVLVGSPLFPRVELDTLKGTLTLLAPATSAKKLYVQQARLNGEPLDRAWLRMDELGGSTLELDLGPTPSAWGRENVPPSFP